MSAWQHYAAVGLGSALGASLRYGIALSMLGPVFPWPTLLANGVGSWLIGALVAAGTPRLHSRVARWQPFLAGGFCGGFTTFSLFGLETLQLLNGGRPWLALSYGLISVPLWLVAAWHGYRVGQRLAAGT